MHRVRVIAAAVSAIAAVSVVAGSLLPLFSASLPVFAPANGPGEKLEVVITSWGIEVGGGQAGGGVPANGLPLLVAGVLLACAALLCRRAAHPGATPGAQRLAGLTTLAGAAFLACAAMMVLLQVVSWAQAYQPSESIPGFESESDFDYRAGLWILLAAAVLGVVAAVFALLPVAEAPVPEVDPDAPTPPYGLSLPLSPPVEGAPPVVMADPLTGATLDPLTGAPEPPAPLPPVVVPVAPPPRRPGPAVPLTDDPLAEPGHG
jgi:hypothetical protein